MDTNRMSVRLEISRLCPILSYCRYELDSVTQPFYTRGTLNIVEESWRHTNPILHIGGGGERDGLWH
jgi:hypothetical protein